MYPMYMYIYIYICMNDYNYTFKYVGYIHMYCLNTACCSFINLCSCPLQLAVHGSVPHSGSSYNYTL